MSRPYAKTLTSLAVIRVIFGGVIILLFDKNNPNSASICLALFFISHLLDHLDGYIARKYSVPTINGFMEDLVADKLFQIAGLLVVTREFEFNEFIFFLLFIRELLVMATMCFMSLEKINLPELKIYSYIFVGFIRAGILTFFSLSAFNSIFIELEIENYIEHIAHVLISLSLIPAILSIPHHLKFTRVFGKNL